MPESPRASLTHSGHRQRSLPPQISTSIPSCAQSCLEQYIGQQYSCPEDDFSCLCSTYSSGGYSLGEFAYLCLSSDCALPSTDTSLSAYEICSSQSNAVRPTKSTLTPPMSTATMQSSSPSGLSVMAPATSMSSATATLSAITFSSDSTVTSTTASPQTSTTTSFTPAPTFAHSSSTSELTTGQAVGVSVAAMGSVVVAVLAVWWFMHLRRRRAVKSLDSEKGSGWNEKHDPPELMGTGSPNVPQTVSHYGSPESQCWTEKKTSDWPLQQQSEQPYAYSDPRSNAIYDPTRPILSGGAPPSHPAPHQQRIGLTQPLCTANLPTPATVLESEMEARNSPLLPSVTVRPPSSAHLSARWKPMPPLPTSGQYSNASEIHNTSTDNFRLPDLRNLRVNCDVNPDSLSRSASSKTVDSLLDYYQGMWGAPLPTLPTLAIGRPQQPALSSRRSSTRSRHMPRPKGRRGSLTSDTSFESVDEEDATPPDEPEKMLTPIKESSPSAQVRYPKVPRGSNQMVPRRPVGAAPGGPKRQPSHRTRYPIAIPNHGAINLESYAAGTISTHPYHPRMHFNRTGNEHISPSASTSSLLSDSVEHAHATRDSDVFDRD